MRRLSLNEYRTTPAVHLTREQRELLQSLAPSVSVTPTRGVEDQFDLTPGSSIGAIELPDLAIEISPKVPLQRVFFLVSYAVNPRAWRETTFSFGTSRSLVEAMIPPFAAAVSDALRRGVLQGYRLEHDALPTVRGRIRFDEQLKIRFGRVPPIFVEFDEFTEDIEPNRILKAAISRLGRLRIRSAAARQALRSFDHALERVSDVEYDPRQLPAVTYTRLNERYRTAVELGKLILRTTSLELEHGGQRGASFLLDMNRVFEDFVVVALREALRLSHRELVQGAHHRLIWLDRRSRIRLRPDLSWWMQEGASSWATSSTSVSRSPRSNTPTSTSCSPTQSRHSSQAAC
jgi:5-methylcytosine-specific restriction enzyme subunit McrC